MLFRPLILSVLALGVVAAPLAAQSTSTYARTGRATLRFREVTTTNARLTTPQGEVPISLEQDATIAVLLFPGDSARAWYEALKLTMTSQAGTQNFETASVLRQPFALGFDSHGQVKLVSAPVFPAEFENVTDLTYQFSDFFLRLPSSPLKLGLSWTDSSSRSTSKEDKSSSVSSVSSYRVERDTMVGGKPAFVISQKQQVRTESEGAVPGQPVRAHSLSTGTDEGFYVFSKSGELLGRQRTGTLKGGMTLSGGGGSMEIPQAFTYTNRIERIR